MGGSKNNLTKKSKCHGTRLRIKDKALPNDICVAQRARVISALLFSKRWENGWKRKDR